MTRPRNVLLLIADELARSGLGTYAPHTAHTPHIDRLAARGVRFECAYTTSPICVPARASIATGRQVHETRCWSSAEPYDGRVKGWGHDLVDAGREVISIGKLHYRSIDDDVGLSRQIRPLNVVDGVGWTKGLLRAPLAPYDGTGTLAEAIGAGESAYAAFDRGVTADALAWLSDRRRLSGEPWTAVVSFVSPHYPLLAPPEFYALYDPRALAGPPEPAPSHPVLHTLREFFDYDDHFTDASRGVARAAYYGLCSFLDANVGRILAAVEACGLHQETLVVLTADHGEMLGAKGFWAKSVMYEDAVGVPLVVAGPGVAPAVRADPVSLVDLAPTILEAAAVSASTAYPGRSLLADAEPGRDVLSEYHDGGAETGIFMLRWGRWKYVHYANGAPCQLFDLEDDPRELIDLAGAPAEPPGVVEEGERRLRARLDPREVDARAFRDQARRIEALGGREALLAEADWGFTPAHVAEPGAHVARPD